MNTTTTMDFKPQIIAELDVLRRISVTETAGTFKARSYAAAIKTLQGLAGSIHTMADLPATTKGDGLGKEIRIKIEKILTEGRLNIPEEVRQKAVALEAFQNIYGVGPKKAEQLIADGYTTVAQLRAAAAKDAKLLNKNQRIGLQYYDDLLLRIPRAEMDKHAATLMAAKPAALEGIIVGSYRRGQSNSGDIDMLIRTASPTVDAGQALADFVTALRVKGYIKEVLAQGEHKCLAISQLPAMSSSASAASSAGLLPARRLDLLVTPPEEFPLAVLYFTGSDTFNVAMRAHALTRGFTLNEHALTHVATGRPVAGLKSERDIFAALKVQWREPSERIGTNAFMIL